jgi:hypothetical protein
MQGAMKAPKYLKETGYKCPTNPNDGLVQYAFQTKRQTFQLLASDPELFKDFNTFMGSTMGTVPTPTAFCREIWGREVDTL